MALDRTGYAISPAESADAAMPAPVLVIDDDEYLRKLVTDGSSLARMTCKTAIDGEDGLRVLCTLAEPHIVLVGHMMPVMTGGEMLRKIAHEPVLSTRHIYVPMTVAHNIPIMMEELTKFQSTTHLMLLLPFTAQELFTVLDEAQALLRARQG